MNLDDALLAFFRLTEKFEGVSPSVREFGDEIGAKSTAKASYWLGLLVAADLVYIPEALRQPYEGARTRKLSAKGLQRAYLLTERVA